MAIRLEIHPRKDLTGEKSWERVFDQGEITIGRSSTNDVSLEDPQRVVSSRHAEIRSNANACVLVDVGSTNGTSMNEQQLVPQREYPLQEGDRFIIGDFTIRFFSEKPQTNGVSHGVVDESRTALQSGDADALAYELCRRYAELSGCTTKEREEGLMNMLRLALGRQSAAGSDSLIRKVKVCLSLRCGQSTIAPLPPADVHSTPAPHGANEAAYQSLLAIAQKYCKKPPSPAGAEFISQFARRIDQVLQITFGNLVECLKGRRQFARELEVEATRILNWAPNQIKQSENEQQVGAYLLDALSNPKGADLVMADLEQVFRDLALHQIGLIKGFQESARAVLKEFDPAAIEADAGVAPVQIGPLRLPARFRLFKKWWAWNRFKHKHRRFSEEEVRVFEQVLAPHFAKGYLDVQKAQRRP